MTDVNVEMSCGSTGNAGNLEVVMVHMLFRHGERTTEDFYPNDPYKDETFHPIGPGNLTNRGKQQMYRLGKFLRERYDKLLGPYCTNEIMEVRSTQYTRTRVSALLVLAGLWPPVGQQSWNEDLSWMPMPVDYKILEREDMLNFRMCPRRQEIFDTLFEDPEVRKIYIDPYKDLYDFVSEKSGTEIKLPTSLLQLYMTLFTEKEVMGFTLPDWTNKIFPHPLYEASSLTSSFMNYHPEMLKMYSGYLTKKIIADCKSKASRKDEKKIVLYSAHETTIGTFLDALGVGPHIPNFSSAVILELLKDSSTNDHAVKILYKREVDDFSLEVIPVPGCGCLCPLEEFEEKRRHIIPEVSFEVARLRKY